MYNVEFYREKRGAYAPSPDIEEIMLPVDSQ